MRYFLTLTPFLALGVGAVLNVLWGQGRWIRNTARFLFLSVLLIQGSIFVYRTRDSWAVALGRQSAESYLREHERSFKGYEFLKQNCKPGESVYVAGEMRSFYDQGVYAVISTPDMREVLQRRPGGVDAYVQQARFDYIWVDENGMDEALTNLLVRDYEKVFSYNFFEKPQKFQFRIYRRKAASESGGFMNEVQKGLVPLAYTLFM